jgi:hypothetical protein
MKTMREKCNRVRVAVAQWADRPLDPTEQVMFRVYIGIAGFLAWGWAMLTVLERTGQL